MSTPATAPAAQAEDDHHYPAIDLSIPQFTVRAIITGMVLGAVLSLCNIYAGLKIGWGFNMSITAALLSYGFWSLSRVGFKTRKWNILENNINQTAASSAASISSAGLVAPIPALTMLTGEELTWPFLALWTFSVSLMGVVVAIGLRKQMLLVDKLPFPTGVATGETLKEMYAQGKEAMAKVIMLVAGAIVASALKIIVTAAGIGKAVLPGSIAAGKGALAKAGVTSISFKNLGFSLDPSLLMVGVGAIIGFRAGWSMLLGAIVAWGFMGPEILELGWAPPGDPDKLWFGPMIKWMLWPGVALMVAASLTSFAFSWRSVVRALTGAGRSDAGVADDDGKHEVGRSLFIKTALVVMLLSAILQAMLFGVGWGIALFGVLLTFLLAIVAGRVSGETGITPVGPMGKVTQLTFGAIDPGNVASNLMTANVTGGAASQCADLLHDMKTGLMVGASPRFLAFAQFFGVLAGALAGSAAYLLLVPDPKGMLMTEEWAAPAVAQWKAVAELFKDGLDKMPPGAVAAMLWAGGLGVVLAIGEKVAGRWKRFIPSPTAMGIAIVIPAYYSVSMFIGAFAALIAVRYAKRWSTRFLIVLASGLIAGDSLTGVVLAIGKILGG